MEIIKGLLIIAHDGLRKITNQEIAAALPTEWLAFDRQILHLGDIIPLGEERNIHWESHKLMQTRWFRDTLLPALREFEDYEILYFGMTHIPLAMHLGFLFGERYKVLVFQCPRETKNWKWALADESTQPLDFEVSGLPQDNFNGPAHATIRMGTYAKVPSSETNLIVTDAAKEIDIHLKQADPTGFKSRAQLEAAAAHFFKAVHSLCDKMPDLKAIHVFAAVPPGLAFLLGKQVSPNKDSPVFVYHYKKEDATKYKLAMKLQPENLQPPKLSDEERDIAKSLRFQIAQHFDDRVKPFAAHCNVEEGIWVPDVHDPIGTIYFQNPIWDGLAALENTGLKNYGVLTEGDFIQDEPFFVNENWRFSDRLLHLIHLGIPDHSETLKAIRLFVFHEAIHIKTHGATSNTTKGIGQFPKVVETIDYQADVYALLHEIAFEKQTEDADNRIGKSNFLAAIDVMLKTMWSFDQYGNPEEMQLRRLNRYLMWYFQYSKIRDENCQTEAQILRILSVKPDIEIRGLDASLDPEGRHIVRLNARETSRLEIAAIVNHRLHRYGYSENAMNLQDLLSGFIQKDADAIKQILQTIVDFTR